MGDRHDAAQEGREVLVFRAVGLLAHGVIIAQSAKGEPMSTPKKKRTVRGTRLEPDPPVLQDVLNEIEDIKGTLVSIQYAIGELTRKIDELPGEIERS